jgi:hypothetical protein
LAQIVDRKPKRSVQKQFLADSPGDKFDATAVDAQKISPTSARDSPIAGISAPIMRASGVHSQSMYDRQARLIGGK